MNNLNSEILLYLKNNPKAKQRDLAGVFKVSLGQINKILKELYGENYISEDYYLTEKAHFYIEEHLPKRAIILAAGMGFRMIPLNKVTNKALLIARNETLIERLIKQLHEAKIYDITIVIGYKKEEFEFLIDQYGVKFIVNHDYAVTNSFYSLYLARQKFENAYIIPCDFYFYDNPFLTQRLYSWYMLNDTHDNLINFNKRKSQNGKWFSKYFHQMLGVAYISNEDVETFTNILDTLLKEESMRNKYWEEAIIHCTDSIFQPVIISQKSYIECNCCEDLILIDNESPSLDSKVFNIIMQVFNIKREEIKNIQCTKAGMTNNSFLFEIHNKKYIMRIPGDGTDFLINREQEYEVYNTIKDYDLSDKLFYFDKENGYKITEYINDAHNCDPMNEHEVMQVMDYLRKFHNMHLKVKHEFNIIEKINYYESLWAGTPSIYKDYGSVKQNVLSLKVYIDKLPKEYVLTHIDAVPDNFIFHKVNRQTRINLIDWEYAAMQDPHVDIAMFAIYALYDRVHVDALIDMYFMGKCDRQTRTKIYCYISMCGLLWSNWCEYKRNLGVEFGEYSLRQYRYAKDYYRIVKEELEMTEGNLYAAS